MTRRIVRRLTLAIVSIAVVVAAGLEMALVGLALLLTAAAASLLVLYFEWRGRLRRHVQTAVERPEWTSIAEEESCNPAH